MGLSVTPCDFIVVHFTFWTILQNIHTPDVKLVDTLGRYEPMLLLEYH